MRLSNPTDFSIPRPRSDSGSSHDSSSRRPAGNHIRSFSPTSDDGNLVVHVQDDDTPPPPDQPIIRQSLGAFGASTSGTSAFSLPLTSVPPVQTYTANTAVDKRKQPRFLPGQAVAVPPPPPPEKKKKSTRKPKDGQTYQTGRFRVTQYDFPNSAPKAKARARVSKQPPNLPPKESNEPSGPYGSMWKHDPNNPPFDTPTAPVSTPSVGPPPFRQIHANYDSGPSLPPPPSSRAPSEVPSSNQVEAIPAPPSTPSGPQYLRRGPQTSPRLPTADAQHQTHAYLGNSFRRPVTPILADHSPPEDVHRSSPEGELSSVARSSRPLVLISPNKERMVTVLIHDNRSGTDDGQLVEITIQLTEVNDGPGYWADAKAVCHKLQTGPGRIDGPAKVSTMRGEYRQIFLRVTADNEDLCIHANVLVRDDRTMHIFVENTGPPQSRIIISASNTSDSPRTATLTAPPPWEIFRAQSQSQSQSQRKRPHSPSPESERPHSPTSMGVRPSNTLAVATHAPRHHPSTPSADEPQRKRSRQGTPSTATASLSPDVFPNTHVIEVDVSSESESDFDIDEMVVDSVQEKIEQEPDWVQFYKMKAGGRRAQDIYEQYKIVHPWLLKYAGNQAVPDRPYLIKDEHLCKALNIVEPEKWGDECREAMKLLDLYGPEGTVCKDPRVLEALALRELPTAHEKPMKRLRRLLREIHSQWEQRRHGSASYPTN